jgi:hypothetical protein
LRHPILAASAEGGREEGRRIHADFVAVLGWCNLWSDYPSIAYLGFSRRVTLCSMMHTMRRNAGNLILSASDLSNFLPGKRLESANGPHGRIPSSKRSSRAASNTSATMCRGFAPPARESLT